MTPARRFAIYVSISVVTAVALAVILTLSSCGGSAPAATPTTGTQIVGVNGGTGTSTVVIGSSAPPTATFTTVTLPGVVGDGVTDDAAAIQTALNAGGTVSLPPPKNFYRVSIPLKIYSNTNFSFAGVIKLDGHFNPGVSPPAPPQYPYGLANQVGVLWIQENASTITIDGAGLGIVDGNRANQTTCCIGGIVAGGPTIGDYNSNVANVTIKNLTVQHVENWPISLDGINGASVQNVTAFDAGNTLQFAHGSQNVGATGLKVSNVQDICVGFYNMVTNGSIVNSSATGCAGSGFGALSDNVIPADAAHSGLSANLTMDHNTVTNSNGGQDTNNQRDNSKQFFTNVQISAGTTSGNKLYGIGISGCGGCRVLNNTSTDAVSLQVFKQATTNLTVSGNHFTGKVVGWP